MAFRGATFLLFVNWLCIVVWLSSTFESIDASIVVLVTNDTYIDRTAAFGPRIPDEGLYLNLIAVESLDSQEETTACHRLSSGPQNASWVALVERGGDCSFVDKVRNMQASGAKAVIVGDNQKSGLITMYAREDTSDVLIPSVFITQNHYRELQYLGMELGTGFLVQLLPDEMDWPVLDAIVFIILSPAFVVLFMFFLWKVRQRQQRLADLAPPEVVSNLPIKVFYKAKVRDNEPLECVICLEEYQDEEELRVLPCRHEYHTACIDNWLTTRKKFCPICKRDICAPTETTPLLGSSPSLPSPRLSQACLSGGASPHSSMSESELASSSSSSTASLEQVQGCGGADADQDSGHVIVTLDSDDAAEPSLSMPAFTLP
ncbi:hypothetical protein KVV02_003904 [Mortierella alpina]|uniref:RING-type domain-containing protein n=1 Tax=Mortierella alpina TaxID=64518 RepID=A0A9P8CUQ8_MORAP|nr:hypothetical protein KVV02_003904 [Mortierella alpina]